MYSRFPKLSRSKSDNEAIDMCSKTFIKCIQVLLVCLLTPTAAERQFKKCCQNGEIFALRGRTNDRIECSKLLGTIMPICSIYRKQMTIMSESNRINMNAETFSTCSLMISDSIMAKIKDDHCSYCDCMVLCCRMNHSRIDDSTLRSRKSVAGSVNFSRKSESDNYNDKEGINTLMKELIRLNNIVDENIIHDSENCTRFLSSFNHTHLLHVIKESLYGTGNGSRIHKRILPQTRYSDKNSSHRYSDIFELTLMILSCWFLLATLLAYAIVPSLHQNLHGKVLMCHATSLLFAFICLIVLGKLSDDVNQGRNISQFMVSLLTYLRRATQFWFQSAFLWLNIMSFDIWRTFGGFRRNWIRRCVTNVNSNNEASKGSTRKAFIGYCCYAWGISLLLTFSQVIGDAFHVAKTLERLFVSPEPPDFASILYPHDVISYNIPMTITLLVNFLFFVMTTRRCRILKAEIKSARANENPVTRNYDSARARLMLNAKLSVIMGVPWLLQLYVTFLSQSDNLLSLTGIADIVNSLQGLWFFLLFAFKRQVYLELRKRLSHCGSKIEQDRETGESVCRY